MFVSFCPHLFLCARVCSLFWCLGKQTRGSVLGFVVGFGDFGNKRGRDDLTFRLKRSARGALTELEIA